MKKLLIPSAKIVSKELQTLGKLPPIIYPINHEIVFDYLYEQYEKYCDIINIMCYEEAEEVHKKISTYKSKKIIVKDLDKSIDLGYTVYSGIQDDDKEIIINFGDTIVNDNIFEIKGNCFFYAEDYISEMWTFFEEQQGIITKVYDKIKDVESKKKGRLFVGVFKIENAQKFKMCLENAFSKINKCNSTFYEAVQMYSKANPFKAIKTNKWFDIGHVDKYYNSKLEVKSREFNHITIDKNRGILTKTSEDKEKFIGEILWYLRLPKDLEYSRPRIFDYSLSYNKPYVSMEYYSYHTLHELFLYGELTYQQWVEIFKRIKFICEDYKRYKVKDNNIKKSLKEMYLDKTIKRLEKLEDKELFKKLFKEDIIINGKKYSSIREIIDILKKCIPEKLYNINEFNIIHGDLCFANIMVDTNLSFIKVIDPRGKFGDYDIYGDFRYEIAKIFHSIDGGYDYIIKDLFKIDYNIEKNEFKFELTKFNNKLNLYSIALDIFKDDIDNHLEEIELIEALLFLSMIPLHNESIEHQYAMLCTGIEILNRVINIEKN